MADQGFLEPVEWHASLPGVVVSAGALIGDGAGRVLIVKPNYRDSWGPPGGICEFREAPEAGCAREVMEELGIDQPIGRLLAVDWQLSQETYGPVARPVVFFIFDGGTLPTLSGVRLQEAELEDCRFAAESELDSFLAPQTARRLRAAIAASRSAGAWYVPERAADAVG